MNAKVQALRPAPSRSPERQKLADCIVRVGELKAELDRVREARAKIGSTGEALIAVEQAEERLKDAQEREPRRLVDEILGRVAGKSLVVDAEAALKATQDEAARRREIHRLIDEEERQAQTALGYAEGSLRTAVNAVIGASPELTVLLDRYAELQRELHIVELSVEAVQSAIPRERSGWRGNGRAGVNLSEMNRLPAVAAWHSAYAALSTNADAALPAVETLTPPAAA